MPWYLESALPWLTRMDSPWGHTRGNTSETKRNLLRWNALLQISRWKWYWALFFSDGHYRQPAPYKTQLWFKTFKEFKSCKNSNFFHKKNDQRWGFLCVCVASNCFDLREKKLIIMEKLRKLPSLWSHCKHSFKVLAVVTKSVDIKPSFSKPCLQNVISQKLHYANNHLLLLGGAAQNGPDDSSTKSWELSPPSPPLLCCIDPGNGDNGCYLHQ